MVTARERAEWSRTSHVLWMLAEINRDRKRRSKPFTPEDFNPYAKPKKKRNYSELPKADITILKAFL